MKNILRIVAGLIGMLFFLNGLQWIISPANVANSLGMPLLEGAGPVSYTHLTLPTKA